MKYKAILFDLDGTLLDTLADLADSMNSVLSSQGFPAHPVDSYRYFVGDGVDMLVRRVLPQEHRDEETVRCCSEHMRREYQKHMYDTTRPYDGIETMLAELARKNITMVVLSNKPDELTKLMVGRYFGKDTFAVVAGQRPDVGKKPDPAGARAIAAHLCVAPSSFLYLGDTSTDMKTAVAAGMFAVGALWGFRSRDELLEHGAAGVIEKPQELLGFL